MHNKYFLTFFYRIYQKDIEPSEIKKLEINLNHMYLTHWNKKLLFFSGLELGIGAIIGVVVLVLLVILVVSMLIFARVTGRWCFSGKYTFCMDDYLGKEIY